MESKENIRIMIIGDNQIFREGISRLLNHDVCIKVEAMVAKSPESLTKIKYYQPDFIVFNILSSDISALLLLTQILNDEPQINVLVIGFRLDSTFIKKLRALNIKGYIANDISGNHITRVIHAISQGKYFFDNRISNLNGAEKVYNNKNTDLPAESSLLSKREMEVLKLILDGYKSRQVATELSISIRTVQNHRAHIMKKLRVKNMLEMIKVVYKSNLLQ
ncbi:response regulator transcription factor [Fulvivirgaceae bacterium BMA12]|uniref:Response regulator transcription factor n=1 Tax=Agaribacillus aureus TaxID=3051825 RepID=A0ABT8L021_9BACT|nr:response regulator transcription factor [Fulvivirgaceae bacterium BMA12]